MNHGRLLVDGYNVLHAWGWMAGRGRSHLSVARGRLIEAVRAIHDADGLEVTVVYDGRGDRAERVEGGSAAGVEAVFASRGQTADGFIERTVAHSPNASVVVVATADQAERETVTASGATCVSPDELRAWVDRCRKRTSGASRPGGEFENRIPL
jgi:hypothetical protein